MSTADQIYELVKMDAILFHARLVGNQVMIEEDNFEESLTQVLIAEGVDKEDIVINREPITVSSNL